MKDAFSIILFFLVLSSVGAAELPFELKRLNEQRERKIAEIDIVYKQQLEKLKTKYTKAGNLEAANQVVDTLQRLNPVAKEMLSGTRWSMDGGTFQSPSETIQLSTQIILIPLNTKWPMTEP